MSVSRKPPRAAQGEPGRMQREVDDLFRRVSAISSDASLGDWVPSVDVYECEGRFVVVMEVPGMEAEAVRVMHRDGALVVSGERQHRRPQGAVGFLCLERPHGRFSRVIPLEEALDMSRAEARLVRGLLVIEIPRLADRRGREIVIPVRREQEE